MKFSKLGKMVAALILILGFAAPGLAEEDKEKEYRLETVTVSAQKREEDVQKIPMSVGVLDDVRLEEERVDKLYDLDRLIPNLYMASAGGTGTFTYIGIRGRINGDADVDPTVTVLVDGVPYDDFYSMGNNLLYDIERVEVLRGPQSTMYGLNSIAGVINIQTKKPGDTPRVKVYGEGALGPHWDGSWRVGGSVSGPLVQETLYGSIALLSKSQGGYIKNEHTGNLYNDDLTTGVKGSLMWTPTTAWEISLGLAYTDYEADYSETYLPTNQKAADAIGAEYKEWQTDTDWEGESTVQTWAPNLKASYDAGSWKITSISAYRNSAQEFDFDPYLSPTAGYLGYIDHKVSTFTQELRFQSDTGEDAGLQWLAGYFLNVFERNEKLGYGLISNPSDLTIFKNSTLNGNSNALFGQGTYRVLDNALGLTIGLRQEWTERKGISHLGLFEDNTVNDSQFLPKVALDYRITPEIMAYASITQGWRCGGMNMLAADTDQSTYDKETSWTYEIGAKTKLFNDKLLFNTSAFYTTYTDYQDLVYVTAGTAYLTNAPEVRMMGFETEIEAALTKDLLLTASAGYVNAEYEDFPDATYGNFEGNKVMFVPDFDANVAVTYSFFDHFYVRPELQWTGTIYWDRENTHKQNPYIVMNLKAGYTRGNYEVYLFGENLTNQYAFTQATDYVGNGEYYGTPITPLRFGVGASYSF